MTTQTALPRRDELTREQRWDIESIFPTDDAWEAAYAAVAGRIGEFEPYRGRLAESGTTLLAALQLRDEISVQAQRVSGLRLIAPLRRHDERPFRHHCRPGRRADGTVTGGGRLLCSGNPRDRRPEDPRRTPRHDVPASTVYRHYFAQARPATRACALPRSRGGAGAGARCDGGIQHHAPRTGKRRSQARHDHR